LLASIWRTFARSDVMPVPPLGAAGRQRPWHAAINARSNARPVLLSLFAGAAVCILTLLAWSGAELEEPRLQLQEDAALAAFSEWCGTQSDGAEGALPQGEGLTLQRAIVTFSYGDASPEFEWPQDVAHWDCTPQPLPRYWRRNEKVQFHVVASNGTGLERSFTPDLLTGDDLPPYTCGPGQLTGLGFRQMVGLGKHLASAYSDSLYAEAEDLVVRSLDTTRSLASAVGVLMSLLATPVALRTFDEKQGIAIHTMLRSEEYLDTMGARAIARQQVETGNHLLARWCHQLPWPCSRDRKAECMSVERTHAAVQLGDKGMCDLLRGPDAPDKALRNELASQFADLAQDIAPGRDGLLALLSTDGMELAVLLAELLGEEAACGEAQALRPPYASRVAFERWWDATGGGGRWRVLWNGADITKKVKGCEEAFPPGCSDDAMRSLLGVDKPPSISVQR